MEPRSDNPQDLLKAGIAAARAGQHTRARALLTRTVELDRESVLAWLWLSGIVDTVEERRSCLEKVLALDPDNAAAKKGLAIFATITPSVQVLSDSWGDRRRG